MRVTTNRSPENTRQRILDAAFDEFYKNGFQGGSLNRIVDDAATTKGALFHHFKGKKHLGYAVVREVIHPHFKKQWSDPLANSTDPIADLKRIFRQCAKSEKRRFSTERGGVRRGGASGHGRYGQKRPGRGAVVANAPCSFRLSGQLETL